MKSSKRLIITTIICLTIIIIVGVIIKKISKITNVGEINQETQNEVIEETNVYTNSIANEAVESKNVNTDINTNNDKKIYETIKEEETGREIMQVKKDVQFQTAVAGILKNGIPQENEVSEILKNSPKKCGIWVSAQSRDTFLKILKDNKISGFEIDKDGYVKQKEESSGSNAELIRNAIKSNKQYIIDFTGKIYVRDLLSGMIIEQTLESTEPDKPTYVMSSEDQKIIEITNNSKGKFSSKQILEDIIRNF